MDSFDKKLSPCLPGGNMGDMFGELFPRFAWCCQWVLSSDAGYARCSVC